MESKTVDGETTVFKSLIHFKLTFVNGVRQWSNVILLYVDIQFSQYYLLTRFPFYMFLAPLFKISSQFMGGLFLGLFILFHWSLCLVLCPYYTVLITIA